MKTNPYFNAFVALGYIGGVVLLMKKMQSAGLPENMLVIPMLILSLLVFSVAVMAFLFGYQPFRLYFENSKKEALIFFAKTVLAFAGFVIIFLLILLYTVFAIFNY